VSGLLSSLSLSVSLCLCLSLSLCVCVASYRCSQSSPAVAPATATGGLAWLPAIVVSHALWFGAAETTGRGVNVRCFLQRSLRHSERQLFSLSPMSSAGSEDEESASGSEDSEFPSESESESESDDAQVRHSQLCSPLSVHQ
jgi:hypothetical protein